MNLLNIWWIQMALDKAQYQFLLNMVMNLWEREFLDNLDDCELLKKDPVPCN
jgi:hypothetical protein